MNHEQQIAKMKQMERANAAELEQMLLFQKQEVLPDGTVIDHYEIPDGKQAPGYLWIHYQPNSNEVLAAEMNINFDCLIGLNRSPIELRLLCNHVLQTLPQKRNC